MALVADDVDIPTWPLVVLPTSLEEVLGLM